MANSYTKAAFALTVTAGEANMLRLAERAVDILDTNGADEDLALGYDSLGTAFHALFPPKGTSMFESFLDLFDDWSFPYLDCRIDLSEPAPNAFGAAPLHQGGIVDLPNGDWWGWSMMDTKSMGRTTFLSPVTWLNGWPYFGLPGNLGRSPK